MVTWLLVFWLSYMTVGYMVRLVVLSCCCLVTVRLKYQHLEEVGSWQQLHMEARSCTSVSELGDTATDVDKPITNVQALVVASLPERR